MSDVIVAPETRDLDDLSRDLRSWLSGKLPQARDLALQNFTYPRGAGQSHETILFDASWTEGGEPRKQGCVVRIKPEKFTVFPDTLFEEQYQIMKALHEDGRVRIAEPLWLEEDAAVLGKPFFVMEKKHGRVPVSIPPYARSGWMTEASPQQLRILWQDAVTQLALIQTIPLANLAFLGGPEGARNGLAQEWDKYTRFVDWLEEVEPQPILRAGLARLKSEWPEHEPEGLVWGDARIGNMMFGDDYKVVAVMDWEQPSLGGALHDLAWFCVIADTMHGPNSTYGAPLEGMGSHDETVALWEQVSGKSAAGLEWYEQFTQLKMSCTAVRLSHLRGTRMMDDETLAKRLRVA
ncbi:aminoglycoside phosphotransferase (APT) family kinase protein [Novosphingobium chloroacetimidivorans]|uniref:Aminoglycoside phosphotransferase (APT) family kinase protein n=1 Tax=Novosphingobium chloroacetimidivorans TaxID=1428314 RepID=A0A7W7K947_9SPHN|nr:phosphotransferase family protein [Novosphingobium chloroacetimidivorans]MBB4858505.1 aminoglycoside phosphotransferase (APT) family kinase protein [Novosphingobium chloroacetimidivorans]